EVLAEPEQIALGETDRPELLAAAALEVELGRGGPRVAGLDRDRHRVARAPRLDAEGLEVVERPQRPRRLGAPGLAPRLSRGEQQLLAHGARARANVEQVPEAVERAQRTGRDRVEDGA